MIRNEIEQLMKIGRFVTNDLLEPDQYFFLNLEDMIQDDEGNVYGTFEDQFWRKSTNFDGWKELNFTHVMVH